MSLPLSRLLGLLDQIGDDHEHATATIRPEGYDVAVSRLEFAHGVARDLRPGLRSPNLDPTTRANPPKTIDPETGEEVEVPLTSVEAGAIARSERNWTRDLSLAVSQAEIATRQLRTIIAELCGPAEAQQADRSGLDVVRDGDKLRPACAWHRRIGETRAARKDASEALGIHQRTMVCETCWSFLDRHDRRPTIDELEWLRERGRWPRIHDRPAERSVQRPEPTERLSPAERRRRHGPSRIAPPEAS